MKFKVLTLFPEVFVSPLQASLLGRACREEKLVVDIINLRDYAKDRHRQADDSPFGGGAGMVLKADVVLRALDDVKSKGPGALTIYLGPGGQPLTQGLAEELSNKEELILLCGHYEGIDERALTRVDQVISIGDYILTGGESAALVLIDVVARLVPGVLGSEESVREESFTDGLLEYPHFTRPREVEDMEVPPVLLSGNHEEIRRWRKKESIKKTLLNRPDLLLKGGLDEEGQRMLLELVTPSNGGGT